MDYKQAKDIRKKSFGSLLAEQEGGLGTSLKKSISLKTQAKMTGIKESFDPMNIAKKLTGGSNWAPAMVGKLTGRDHKAMEYFAGAKPKKGLKALLSGSEGEVSSPVQILGLIYEELKKSDDSRKLELQEENNKKEEEDGEEDARNDLLIKVLTGRSKKVPSKREQAKAKKEAVKQKKKTKEKTVTTKETPKGTTKEVPKGTSKESTKTITKETPKGTPKTTAKPTETVTSKSSTPTANPITPTTSTVTTAVKVVGAAAAAGGLLSYASKVIAKEEGLPKKGKAYWDPPGQINLVSIGYGHQIKQEEYKQGFIQAGSEQIAIVGNKGIDTVLTPVQAQNLLQQDLPKYELAAKKPLGDSWNKLSDEQKSALISYAYNTGSTQSLVKAGLKEAIDRGDMKSAANIIREKGIKTANGQYVKVLDDRRHKEALLFEAGEVKASEVSKVQNTGSQMDQSSKENKDLKESLNKDKPAIIQNTNNTNTTQTNSQSSTQPKIDDRPAPIKKAQG
jgi:GH24 family phage-related lysozyme (muramidase)